ncbi:MAG: hypothetical protein CMO01_15290 [Thalassobius sp.]|nr:hypothetical protein [Thalassovita sp.]
MINSNLNTGIRLEIKNAKSNIMFKNILKVAFRSLIRQKFYSLINITGLAVGLASCLFILIYISSELNFDKHNRSYEQIYRLNQTNIWSEENVRLTAGGPPVAALLKENYPEVEESARVYQPGSYFITYEQPGQQSMAFEEKRLAGVDTSFITMFDFEWLAGSPQNALDEQNSVVITRSTANRYFGETSNFNESVVGKMLKIDNGNTMQNVVVKGVIEDMPFASHFHFDFMFSIYTFKELKRMEWSWIWSQCVTYVKLKEGTDVAALETKMADLPKKYASNTIERVLEISYEEFEKKGKPWELFLLPLKDIHLRSEGITNPYPLDPVGSIDNLYVFGLAAIFIILLACINFMNLATARAAGRAREIGVRKTLGSNRESLIWQFLFESMIISAFAALLSLGICELLRPYFNELTDNTFHKPISEYSEIIYFLPIATIVTGLLAGIYPAFYLTRFQPVQVLKGRLPGAKGGEKRFRSFLVSIQFAVSTFMVISTALVLSQVKFMSNKDLGYDKENLLSIRHIEMLGDNGSSETAGSNADKMNRQRALKETVSQIPGVKVASQSNGIMPHIYFHDYFKSNATGKKFSLNHIITDVDFLNLIDVELLYGRDFNRENTSDLDKVILNEAAVEQLGYTKGNYEKALGEFISYPYPSAPTFEVIGIMKDAKLEGGYNESQIGPIAVFLQSENIHDYTKETFLTVKVEKNTDLLDLIGNIEQAWAKQSGGLPFQYFFVDDRFDALFKTEVKLGKVLGVFTFIAVLIAVLGLLGLVSYISEKKTKEIGIRKVLGASPIEILLLLSKEFTFLLIAGFLIAAPLSYYFISSWLANYADRVSISPLVFILALVGGLLLAWITISLQALKAIHLKAVDAIRTE